MGDNTLPDQVAGMKELARRFPFIDIDGRHLGPLGRRIRHGRARCSVIPDFFKVGISESGNHDNRNYEDDWGERYQGLLTRRPDGSDNYAAEANQTYAKNLKGKLLLAARDDGRQRAAVQHAARGRRADQGEQGFRPDHASRIGVTASATTTYMMRRRWDYFVKHLLGAEPPKEYQIKPAPGPR